MPKTLQKKQVESLVSYVDKLQSLNENVKPKFPKISADKLRKDPKSYAYDVIDTRAKIGWNNMNSSDCMVWKYFVRYREVGTNGWTTKSAGVVMVFVTLD